MEQTTFGRERCKHKRMRPYRKSAGFLKLRCSCGKTRQAKGLPCPSCGPLVDAYNKGRRDAGNAFTLAKNAEERDAARALIPPDYEPGCEQCFEGLTLPRWVQPCCCYKRGRRCSGCENVAERNLPHICLVDTAEEIDYELATAEGLSAPAETAGYDIGQRASERGMHADVNGPRA